MESATSIAEMICYYAIFEELCLCQTSPATDELKRALVQFYAVILTYLSEAKSYFDQNSASQYQAAIFGGIELRHTKSALSRVDCLLLPTSIVSLAALRMSS